MFTIRVRDIFFIKGHPMVLSGRVEAGEVRLGSSTLMKTPEVSVRAVISGIERDRKIVAIASTDEDVALLIRGAEPSDLIGGVTRVQADGKAAPMWQVTDLVLEGAPSRWWEFWK